MTDPSGGTVPGVSVVATNLDTGVARDTVTNETGFYRIQGLQPGRYRVVASLSGFREAVFDNVQVTAENVQGLDVTLQPGGVQETVTVTAAPTALPTENAEVAGTLGTVEIQRLPQIGRDPYELVRLTPGMFGLGARDAQGNAVGFPNQAGPGGSSNSVFQTENQVSVTANGQRIEGNNYQLDGVNAMSQAWGGAAVVTPNQESVKEIRVVANPYSAEYGRNTGAQVQVVSQNGTNDFHGSAVFKRNTPGLNAYQKWGGPHGEAPQRANQLLSQTAASVGGPILRNKLFFFFSYEGYSRNLNTLGTDWVETPELVAAIQAQRPNTIASQVLSFPGMTPRVGTILEERDIGSLTGGVGQLVTNPQGGGLDGVPDIMRAQLQAFNRVSSRQFNTRVDYTLSPSDQLAFSTFIVPAKTESNDAAETGNATRPAEDFTSSRKNMVGTALWTRTISPTMVNEARVNVTRWYFNEIQSNPDMPWGIPRLNVNQTAPENLFFGYGPGVGPGVFYQTSYNARDMLTKVVNAHALRFGGEVILEQNNDRAPWAGRPTYTFDNLWSFANDAPSSEGTTFFDPTSGAFTEITAYARSRYYALFVQDDWKPRPNLTINAGLRWEYFSPLTSKNDHISNLVLGPNGGLQGASLSVGGNLYQTDKNNFGPQLGFAWTPGRFAQKAVVRGGFGVGYNRLPGNRTLESRFNPPFFAGFLLTGDQILYSTAATLTGFDYPANPAAQLEIDPATNIPVSGPPVSVSAVQQDIGNPYSYRYSLETEYEVGKGWVASIGYQGSAAHHLTRLVPYQLLVSDPNPRLGTVNMVLGDVNSNFNALLTRITRRYTNGLLFNAEYRWAKSIDECSTDACQQTYPFDIRQERGPSDFDVRHSFRGYATYQLPFLRDRTDALGKIAGGWDVSGIVTASSGFPWTPVVGGGLCAVTVAGGGVCPLRPVAFTGGNLTGTSDDVFKQQFGQFPGGPLQYFTPPPAGSFTEPPPPGVGRNSFRGPNYFSLDATLVKRFGLPAMPVLQDNAGIEIRVNAYNLFNNLNLTPFGFNQANTEISNPDFGRALSALSGRVVEFQARLSF